MRYGLQSVYFMAQAILRFLVIFLLLCTAYIVHGGHVSVIAHGYVVPLMYSFGTSLFLMFPRVRPNSFYNEVDVRHFRTLVWRVMIVTLIVFFSFSALKVAQVAHDGYVGIQPNGFANMDFDFFDRYLDFCLVSPLIICSYFLGIILTPAIQFKEDLPILEVGQQKSLIKRLRKQRGIEFYRLFISFLGHSVIFIFGLMLAIILAGQIQNLFLNGF